jgi:hypothetical protein
MRKMIGGGGVARAVLYSMDSPFSASLMDALIVNLLLSRTVQADRLTVPP